VCTSLAAPACHFSFVLSFSFLLSLFPHLRFLSSSSLLLFFNSQDRPQSSGVAEKPSVYTAGAGPALSRVGSRVKSRFQSPGGSGFAEEGGRTAPVRCNAVQWQLPKEAGQMWTRVRVLSVLPTVHFGRCVRGGGGAASFAPHYPAYQGGDGHGEDARERGGSGLRARPLWASDPAPRSGRLVRWGPGRSVRPVAAARCSNRSCLPTSAHLQRSLCSWLLRPPQLPQLRRTPPRAALATVTKETSNVARVTSARPYGGRESPEGSESGAAGPDELG
jgi:hypothetical protein